MNEKDFSEAQASGTYEIMLAQAEEIDDRKSANSSKKRIEK